MPRRRVRRGGRPQRQSRIRVRTERRADIDFAALARAVLEQAAMDQQVARPSTPLDTTEHSTPTEPEEP